jgi:hypothetical protein
MFNGSSMMVLKILISRYTDETSRRAKEEEEEVLSREERCIYEQK